MATLYRIYIDDSGNVDPATTNAPELRYGSITGVIFDADYLDKTFNTSFPELVKKHFGAKPDGTPLNLHRRVLASPPDHGPFSVLKDDAKKAAWDADALSMFQRATYTVISSCVDKVAWYHRYPDWNGDFYQVLVEAVLERSFYFLHRRNGVAEVNIETKGSRDQRLKEQYRKTLEGEGFRYITADKLRGVFTSREMNILKKDDCKPGGQMADLLAGPALRHIRFLNTNRYPVTGGFTAQLCYVLEKEKFYREAKRGPHGFGRIWRPQ